MFTNKGMKLKYFMHCLKEGQLIRVKLSGNSMSPTYKDGDMLLIRVKKSNLAVGDIVAKYDVNDIITVHRIVGMKRRNDDILIMTKGDHNFYFDGWCSMNQVIGVVVDEEGCSHISADHMH